MQQKSQMVMPVTLVPGPLAVVKSESDPNKSYQLMVSKVKTVYCTCPAWRFSKGNKTCKHLRRFMQEHPNVAAAERALEAEIFGPAIAYREQLLAEVKPLVTEEGYADLTFYPLNELELEVKAIKEFVPDGTIGM